MRHISGKGSWSGLVLDLRLAFRTLLRRPLYAVGVSGTLALGLVAAMITFAVAWNVWLSPLPIPDPDRVVRLYEIEPPDSAGAAPVSGAIANPDDDLASRRHQLSAPLLEDFRAHSWRTVESVSALVRGMELDLARGGETARYSGAALSPEGFGILGIEPILGRLPAEIEGEVLISERLWRSAFGADPDILGSLLTEDPIPIEIVGVAPFPSGIPGDPRGITVLEWTGADVREENRTLRFVDAFARVRPEHSVSEARAEVNAFLATRSDVYPVHRGWSVEVVRLAESLVRPFRGVLAMVLAAGVAFLLLAGVNVTGLVAARRVEGRHDRSIRLALGASEGRLLRGSVIDSLLLALVGGAVGVLGAYWLVEPIRTMVPRDVPRLADVAVTPALALGGMSVAVAVGMVVGLWGYLISRGMKQSAGPENAWWAVGLGGRRALVVGQVALTTLLVAAGAGILQHVSRLNAIDLGFEPEGISTTTTRLTDSRYPSNESKWEAWRSILEGLEDQDVLAALVVNAPMAGEDMPPLAMRGESGPDEFFYQAHLSTGDYFSLMGIQLLAGRVFGPGDGMSSGGEVVVSREFVDRYFPPGVAVEEAVGRVIGPVPFAGSAGAADSGEGPEIVGVVESTRHTGPDAPVAPDLYMPFTRWMDPPGTLLVRGEPAQVSETVSSVTNRLDPDLSWTPLIPYTNHLWEWFAPLRLQVAAVGVLGGLGLLLACLGLYSLMAYQVATRRKEIGVRKAVGASDASLVLGVVGRGLSMALVGAVLGLGAWHQLLPRTRELLDGVESAGSLMPLVVVLVVGGSCLLATLVPAFRAARVDPVVTLNAE